MRVVSEVKVVREASEGGEREYEYLSASSWFVKGSDRDGQRARARALKTDSTQASTSRVGSRAESEAVSASVISYVGECREFYSQISQGMYVCIYVWM